MRHIKESLSGAASPSDGMNAALEELKAAMAKLRS
ncbi:MAG: hypothetical protein QOJ59_2929 [Thermomicrobiales bacterium]|jgi:hypothetical protein|nr:hypothetical protein [Thermomicrobiales bacterium]